MRSGREDVIFQSNPFQSVGPGTCAFVLPFPLWDRAQGTVGDSARCGGPVQFHRAETGDRVLERSKPFRKATQETAAALLPKGLNHVSTL